MSGGIGLPGSALERNNKRCRMLWFILQGSPLHSEFVSETREIKIGRLRPEDGTSESKTGRSQGMNLGAKARWKDSSILRASATLAPNGCCVEMRTNPSSVIGHTANSSLADQILTRSWKTWVFQSLAKSVDTSSR